MKKSIVIAAFAMTLSLNIHATEQINAVSKVKKQLIDTLLEQSNQSATNIAQQLSSAFIQQMSMIMGQNPNTNPRAFEILEEVVNGVIYEEMVENTAFKEQLYPIYAQHFSEDELKKMIEFNKTELGQKMINVMPTITQEVLMAGQMMGQTMGPKIQQRMLDRLEKEGIE